MTRDITRRALAFAAGGMLLLGASAGGAQQLAQVTIDNFAFAPAILTVHAGTKVEWLNKDEEPHTVLSADAGKTFKSPGLDTNDKFSFVFDKPGTYKYFCSVHSHMVGTIVVQ